MAKPAPVRRRVIRESEELEPDYVQTGSYSEQRYRPFREEEVVVDSEERSNNRLVAIILVLLILAASAGGYQYRQSIWEWPIMVQLKNWWYGPNSIVPGPPPRRYFLLVASPNAALRAEPHRAAIVTAHLPRYYQALMLGHTQQNWNGDVWYKVRVATDAQIQEGWLCERDVFCQPSGRGF